MQNYCEIFNASRIVVVGGAGFVGSNLVKTLLSRSRPAKITVIDNLLSAERFNIPEDPRVCFIEGSITNETILEELSDDVDHLFHLATYHGNQSSIANPLEDHENNTLTTLKLFNRLRDFKKIRKVVYSSAGCTVAEKTFDTPRPTTEEDPVSLYLDSPYQISKIIGEMYANYFFMQYGLPVVKARFQNVYGPGEVLGAGRWRGTPATVWRNVAPTFIYRSLKRMPLLVENEGKATRDFIYVDDIVNGLLKCATSGKAGDVYNLAGGAETSILDLARTINEMTGSTVPVEIGPMRNWDHSGRRFGCTSKSKDILGFEATVDLRAGLRNTIAWTKENLERIDACIARHDRYMKVQKP
jgi:nucleoside-diphosphate-sugar epimerase